jgi:F-type H+-transporting ATPase subunit b
MASPALAASGGGEISIFAGDIGNAIWTLVIFGLVLFVLGKYAWGPMLDSLQQREKFIRESLEQAKSDRESAESRLKEYEEKLTEARAEATAIVEGGRLDGDELRRTIEDEARGEADKMVERAKREIQIAQQTAVKELYSASALLATDLAGRVLGREVNAEDHERLIAESLDELGNIESN